MGIKYVLDQESLNMIRYIGTEVGDIVSDVCAVLTTNVNIESLSLDIFSVNLEYNWEYFPMLI